jgi:hypothetical protein
MAKISKPDASELEKMLQEQISATWTKSGLGLKASKDFSLYEIFVFTLVLEAAEELGAKPIYKKWSGTKVIEINEPRFITGPHTLFMDGDVFAEFRIPSRKVSYEVHLGVYYEGKSGILHECDVSVISERKATKYRRLKQNPKHRDLIAGIECKYYSQHIDIGMVREFLGLSRDLTVHAKGNLYIVNPPIVKDGDALLRRHKLTSQPSIVPTLKASRPPKVVALIDKFKTILKGK